MSSGGEEATLLVSRRIKQGRENEYGDWVRRVIAAANEFPGYRGVTTLAPQGFDSDVRYMIWRFDNQKDLDNWERSDVRHGFFVEVQNYAEQHYEKATGMETWFSLPEMHKVVAPPKWKMFLVTTFAAYCVSLVARTSLTPFLGSWPSYLTNLIFSAILVSALTYILMPWFSRVLRGWLYSSRPKG